MILSSSSPLQQNYKTSHVNSNTCGRQQPAADSTRLTTLLFFTCGQMLLGKPLWYATVFLHLYKVTIQVWLLMQWIYQFLYLACSQHCIWLTIRPAIRLSQCGEFAAVSKQALYIPTVEVQLFDYTGVIGVDVTTSVCFILHYTGQHQLGSTD